MPRRRPSAKVERLVVDHMKLALGMAAKFRRKSLPNDQRLYSEVESAALWGLFQAARAYRKKRGTRFDQFAGARIIGAIQDALRKADYMPRTERAAIRRA